MTDSTLIELDCVSKSSDGGRSFAVNDLSLAIERGSFVTLVGPSGSGKTTTCKFINRLIDRCRAQGGADYGGGHTPRADGRTRGSRCRSDDEHASAAGRACPADHPWASQWMSVLSPRPAGLSGPACLAQRVGASTRRRAQPAACRCCGWTPALALACSCRRPAHSRQAGDLHHRVEELQRARRM